MNTITIIGRLGADPETRFTSNGKKVTTFRVAESVRKNGKEDTIWWRVTLWGDTNKFDNMMPYFKKGSSIVVVGEVSKPEIYTGKDGQPQVSMDVTAHSIHFNPSGAKPEGQNQAQQYAEGANNQSSNETTFGEPAFSAANAKPSYGQNQAQAYGQSSSHNDEEPMPF